MTTLAAARRRDRDSPGGHRLTLTMTAAVVLIPLVGASLVPLD